jgi:hypothetical protein
MQITLGGVRGAVPKWSLSKAELVETVGAEADNNSLRLGKVGDWEKLREEFSLLEREVRRSGSVAYSAPDGKHDDLAIALALAVFGCRRFGGAPVRRIRKRPAYSSAAWT